jgi:hypothetical protein
MRPRMSDPLQPLPRASLAATCFGHAAVFAWAGSALPWRSGTFFAALATLLALLHLATAVTALLRKPVWLTWVWRVLSGVSALAFVIFVWTMAAAALYVSKLYPRLGAPVAGGILLGALLLSLVTLPIAIWGARRTWPAKARAPRRLGMGGALLGALFVLTLPLAGGAAHGEPMRLVSSKVTSDLSNVLEGFAAQPASGARRTVAGAGPANCSEPITSERLTLLVAFVAHQDRVGSVCLQAKNPRELRRALDKLLAKKARSGSTVVLDLVKSAKQLSPKFPLLDALEVRPGLDGVCEEGRCLPAWQLTLTGAFSENHPIASMPEASYGFSTELARKALGTSDGKHGPGLAGLLRIETESLLADSSGVHHLERTRATPPALSPAGIEQAVTAAQSYIALAQEEDGTFRYALDPTTGTEDKATLNLPRQAGTTYALCELGRGPELQGTVQRALAAFEAKETRFGDVSALQDSGEFGLGKSALPLLAMLRCRSLAGAGNDRLIGQLTRLLFKLQRENGSFYPVFDAATQRGQGVHEVMYAAGQAVLSFVLLEQQLDSLKGSAAEPLPSKDKLKSVLDHAMGFYAGPYWPKPLRDFFFFEEGWHCQAARHALTSHRNDAYEQLCLDYVGSRARFVARAADTSEPNFVGGYALGDIFPPSNTATSGVGEALDAAITIKQKRGLPVEADKAILRDLVTFLLRAQWSEAGCYACLKPSQVIGGFSQQLAAPSIRIDYVQHAMSAIGHGGELLF